MKKVVGYDKNGRKVYDDFGPGNAKVSGGYESPSGARGVRGGPIVPSIQVGAKLPLGPKKTGEKDA